MKNNKEKNEFIKKFFAGRLNRSHYFLSILLFLFGIVFVVAVPPDLYLIQKIISYLLWIFLFSVSIRRLHDFNQSGYYTLIFFIYFAGIVFPIYKAMMYGFIFSALFVLYLLLKEGNKYTNKYGPKTEKKSYIKSLLNKS